MLSVTFADLFARDMLQQFSERFTQRQDLAEISRREIRTGGRRVAPLRLI